MKKILFLGLMATVISSLSLYGQLDPEDRRGVYLNFEEETEEVDLVDVVAVGCDEVPDFDVVDNPDRDGNFDDWNTANVGKIITI